MKAFAEKNSWIKISKVYQQVFLYLYAFVRLKVALPWLTINYFYYILYILKHFLIHFSL